MKRLLGLVPALLVTLCLLDCTASTTLTRADQGEGQAILTCTFPTQELSGRS